eukprot:TRINITY_DN3821_c1_g1_i1.p1 TRINITY_DN3821_c1_g1~~TRINITY_DN3821_c1_g1_i1.p1  ORF type:complete len:927 (+),score=199.21 TRINITY_DN3821_c1_g1_i1:58-2838(+)
MHVAVARGKSLYKNETGRGKVLPAWTPPNHRVHRSPTVTQIIPTPQNVHSPHQPQKISNFHSNSTKLHPIPLTIPSPQIQPHSSTKIPILLTESKTSVVHNPIGTLVEYREEGSGIRKLGILEAINNNNNNDNKRNNSSSNNNNNDDDWTLITKTGYISIKKEIIMFLWPQQYLGQLYKYGVNDISRLEQLCAQTLASYKDHLKIAWGSYVDKNVKWINADMLSYFLFGQNPKPHEFYVSHCLLMEDEIYFEKDIIQTPTTTTMDSNSVLSYKYVFTCRPLSQVSRLQNLHKIKKSNENHTENFIAKARQVLETKETVQVDHTFWTPTETQLIEKIKWYALNITSTTETTTTSNTTSTTTECKEIYNELIRPLQHGNRPSDAFRLLVRLGIWTWSDNIPILRRRAQLQTTPPLHFSTEEIKQGDILSKKIQSMIMSGKYEDEENIVDLNHIQHIFAIDDPGSTEIDDCISLVKLDNGHYDVYVHIADPSKYINPNDNLDKIARNRVSSLYLPEKSYSMFPPTLTEKHFSLLPSKNNYALSFKITMSPHTGRVENYQIFSSTFQNVLCLTYEEADAMIESTLNHKMAETMCSSSIDSSIGSSSSSSDESNHHNHHSSQVLSELYNIAIMRRNIRRENGAEILLLPSPDITVKNNGNTVEISPMNVNSKARTLVSEFMILVGELTADFALKHKIPIPYRSNDKISSFSSYSIEKLESRVLLDIQEANHHEDNGGVVGGGGGGYINPTLLNYLQNLLLQYDKRRLHGSRAKFSVDPSPHHGLGLKAYCQATSPIRRYLDLLVHYQIKAVLRGENPPFDRNQISLLTSQLDFSQQQHNKLRNLSSRYWFLRFIENQNKDTIYLTLTLWSQQTQVLVMFIDLGYEMTITLSRSPKRGELLRLIVSHVDAVENQISFCELEGVYDHHYDEKV